MTNTLGHRAPPPSSTPTKLDLRAAHPMLSCLDILQEVGSHLTRRDLYRCLPVSKAFYNAMAPVLYRHVKVTKTQFIYTSNPVELFRTDTSALPRRLVRAYTTSVELPVAWLLRSEGTLASIKRLRTLILPHGFVRFFNVKIKRIVFRPVPIDTTAPCWCNPRPYEEPLLLSHNLPSSAPHTVIELHRLDFGMRYEVPYEFWDKRRKFKTPSGTVTLVVLPDTWDSRTFSPLGLLDNIDSEFADSLIGIVTDYAVLYPSRVITIVGLEVASPFGRRWHWEDRETRLFRATAQLEDVLHRKLDTLPATRHWTTEQKTQRKNSVRVVALYDYLNAGGWGGEMDPRDVGNWLNAYDKREKIEARAATRKGIAPHVTTLGKKRKNTSHEPLKLKQLSGDATSHPTKKVKTRRKSMAPTSSAGNDVYSEGLEEK